MSAPAADAPSLLTLYKCDLCQVSMHDPAMMEAHFSGKKHLKNVRNVSLKEQQEGKAVYVTNLGYLKLPQIHDYFSGFGTIVNMIPGHNRDNPDLLHHVIVEFSEEDAVIHTLSKQFRDHKIEIPGSQPQKYQHMKVFERKFRERRRSPSPAECPGVSHDQVMLRLSLMSADPDLQLVELTSLLNLDQEEVENRVNICRNMQRTFSNHFPSCVVYPFGSSLNGLGFPGSDLDIYMDLPVNLNEKQKVLRARRILSTIPQCSRLQPIVNARVPIIKFIHGPSGIHCDIR